jgi:membrane protein DedA with SNARE-associated domain
VEDYLNQFMQFAQDNAYLAYTMLFISAFVENVFPPIPGDTVTLIGAYFVGTGHLNYFGVFISTTAGSVIGFMTLFLLAFWLEWKVVEKYNFKWIKRAHIDRVQAWFQKYGYRVILANRFLSGVRSVISITAGLSKLKISAVLLLSFLSALIWNGLIISSGALIGDNWRDIEKYLKLYNQIIIIGLLIAAAGYLVYFLIYKRKLFERKKED